jgi:hypothetical protein
VQDYLAHLASVVDQDIKVRKLFYNLIVQSNNLFGVANITLKGMYAGQFKFRLIKTVPIAACYDYGIAQVKQPFGKFVTKTAVAACY